MIVLILDHKAQSRVAELEDARVNFDDDFIASGFEYNHSEVIGGQVWMYYNGNEAVGPITTEIGRMSVVYHIYPRLRIMNPAC